MTEEKSPLGDLANLKMNMNPTLVRCLKSKNVLLKWVIKNNVEKAWKYI